MITLYSGTPGSGKSYHTAYMMYYGLRFGKSYICNFNINLENVAMSGLSHLKHELFKVKKEKLPKKKLGKYLYVRNDELTPTMLIEYAMKNHSRKKEGETTIVIDECGMIFNARQWDNKERMKWIEFFSMHRHYGFDVILISQSERMIDRQIRCFIEYDIRHRKMNNYKLFGKILGIVSGGCLFGCVKYWSGVREKIEVEYIRYSKRVASIYDTFLLMHEENKKIEVKDASDGDKGSRVSVGVPLTLSDADTELVAKSSQLVKEIELQ